MAGVLVLAKSLRAVGRPGTGKEPGYVLSFS
jgi:hypothetical protein